MDFSGKSIIISGGSRGIGLAVAEIFATRGANVAIIARDATRLEEAANLLKNSFVSQSQEVCAIQLDVSEEIVVEETISEWIRLNGTPDILVNSAGYAHPGLVQELSGSIFRKTMDINYFGTVNMTKAVLPSMLARGNGVIVNISSMSGFLGIYGYTAYSGSKYAVTGFSDALRNELSPKGIRVSIVFPPDTDTEQLAYESQFKPEVTKIIAGNAGLLSAKQVASAIVRGIEKKQYVITPGFEASFFYWLHNFAGKLTHKILDIMALDGWHKTQK